MTAIVSRERAKTTWLTALAGLLLLTAAVTMMAMAVPANPHPSPPTQQIVLESSSTPIPVPWSRLRP